MRLRHVFCLTAVAAASALGVAGATPAHADPVDDLAAAVGDQLGYEQQGRNLVGDYAHNAVAEVDVNAEDSTAKANQIAYFVKAQCGDCLPGLGGPIGPVPVGPVGDEAFAQVNAIIVSANETYFRAGQVVNRVCGSCLPGLGGPIGPVPVGPVGNPGDA